MLEITGLKNAVQAYERGLNVVLRKDDKSTPEDEIEILRSGLIQSFEFCYELCWKYMKRWIEMNISPDAADGVTRRELFRRAAENRLITDIDKWMIFHAARNRTSHIYNEDVADEVFKVAKTFLPFARDLVERLESRL
ncbi:MAG: nucleotidyltransferase substrate binding protein [Clostridiales bacterium]|jgi:nucleotidyltransferase substrate binding protein (TIGR01987 family)|nr:nucleotidyltransferase substrate binding protein [Clostridiales bacterium]